MTHSSSTILSCVKQWLPSILGIVLFGVSIAVIWHELQTYKLSELLTSLQAIPQRSISLAIALTALNYVMLTGYDTLAVYYVRHPIPYRRTALVATITYAVSNTVGLALLSSSAIRYRFYVPWGFSAIEIANIVAFCNISFWLGLLAVGGIVFLMQPVAIPTLLNLPLRSVYPLGVIFSTLIVAYLIWNALSRRSLRLGSWVIPHLPIQLCLAQITVTSLDWALATAVLYVLLPIGQTVPFPGFFGVYLLGQIAGIISNVPGGLGVFETVMLLFLSPTISEKTLFGALLAYRCIYYFLPLGMATLLLGGYEWRSRWLSK